MAELEKLDPETVKTARSLMAFGALGRARGAAAAASATAAKNGAAAASTEAAAAKADSTQAFAASPDDQKTDVSQIPDPANFEKASKSDIKVSSPNTVDATAAKAPIAVPISAPTSSSAAASSMASPLLVAGLPLVAAVLLMRVYWLILRAGAV